MAEIINERIATVRYAVESYSFVLPWNVPVSGAQFAERILKCFNPDERRNEVCANVVREYVDTIVYNPLLGAKYNYL